VLLSKLILENLGEFFYARSPNPQPAAALLYAIPLLYLLAVLVPDTCYRRHQSQTRLHPHHEMLELGAASYRFQVLLNAAGCDWAFNLAGVTWLPLQEWGTH
jgi:hypothetical protein